MIYNVVATSEAWAQEEMSPMIVQFTSNSDKKKELIRAAQIAIGRLIYAMNMDADDEVWSDEKILAEMRDEDDSIKIVAIFLGKPRVVDVEV